MWGYSNEREILNDENCKVLYYNETQIGVEYVIPQGGKFKKYIFDSNMKLIFEGEVSFSEVFINLTKGIKLMKWISYVFITEIILGMMFAVLIGVEFSLSKFSSLLMNNWLWLACGVLLLIRKNNSILGLVKLVLNSLLIIEVGVATVQVFNYSLFVRTICFIACDICIVCNALLYTLREEEEYLYHSLKDEFSC